tara:strand:- start:11340 stop:11894 length:555 start_codon:yes stop_codon:yes gene_type:complete
MNKNEITKVTVIDFDGTLIDTTMPEIGKKMWKDATGEDFPHKGWWSKRESLNLDIYPNNTFDDIVAEFNKSKSEDKTFVALCTGRITPLTKQVNAVLDMHNLVFDDVVLTGDKRFNKVDGVGAKDTLEFKLNYLNSLQSQFPNLEQIDFFDDRNHHQESFNKWADAQPIVVNIHHVQRDGDTSH